MNRKHESILYGALILAIFLVTTPSLLADTGTVSVVFVVPGDQVVIVIPSGGSGTNPPRATLPDLFDVIVDVQEEVVEIGKKVTATITLKNVGINPNEDTELIYFLRDPEGVSFGTATDILIRVPPVTYNPELCSNFGGVIEEFTGSCIVVLVREILVPETRSTGNWTFAATYYPSENVPLAASQEFEVIDKLPTSRLTLIGFLILLILGLVGLILFIVLVKKKKDK